MIRCSVASARQRWGARLSVAALGAVQKSVERDEWRVVYDATHAVRVNHQIRVRDQVQCPTWPDIAAVMENLEEEDHRIRFALLYDVDRAHRRVPVDERDWGLMACRVDRIEDQKLKKLKGGVCFGWIGY